MTVESESEEIPWVEITPQTCYSECIGDDENRDRLIGVCIQCIVIVGTMSLASFCFGIVYVILMLLQH